MLRGRARGRRRGGRGRRGEAGGGRVGEIGFGFGEEGGEFGSGNVTAEGVEHVLLEIAFGLGTVDAEVAGPDAVRVQLLGEPNVGDGLAVAECVPRTVGIRVERLDKALAEDAVGFVGREEEEDVQEEGADRVGVLAGGGEGDGGLAGQLGPAAAGEVGDGQEGFPDVGGAVVEFGRDLGLSGGDGGGVVTDEAGALLLERVRVEVSEAFAGFVGGLALHAEDDAAVSQGGGQGADSGDDFGAPAGEVGEADGKLRVES